MMRLLTVFSLLAAIGWWQADLSSDATWQSTVSPLMVFIGACGILMGFVLIFPSLRRQSDGGAGIGGDGSGDGC